jgi:hypothetical protein
VTELTWSAPWFAPWREPGEAVAARVAAGHAPHEALNAAGASPVRFVPQDQLPAGTPYERFIFETGHCPVRPGLHDFFNALVWMRFPRAKAALNRLQAAEIARSGIGARRGPVRDAITLFDENGALLQAPPALWEALEARAWRRLFVQLRPLWSEARLCIFGHALLEQLATPRKGLTAHVWRADAALDADADAWFAARCTVQALAAKPFMPLPVLGVPGWWPGNENFSFYDDSLVFRPRKTPEPITTTSAGSSRS